MLLVGLYLTLICPGHDHGGHHSAPHLTVLGEPTDDDAPVPLQQEAASVPSVAVGPDGITLAAGSAAETPGLTVAEVVIAGHEPGAQFRLAKRPRVFPIWAKLR